MMFQVLVISLAVIVLGVKTARYTNLRDAITVRRVLILVGIVLSLTVKNINIQLSNGGRFSFGWVALGGLVMTMILTIWEILD